MPYLAPPLLAAWLKRRYSAKTLVVDAGIEWLTREIARADNPDALRNLRDPATYRDIWTVRRAHDNAASALDKICAPWYPERVEISSRYYPATALPNWHAVDRLLDLERPSIFDEYYLDDLIPRLTEFDPHIVGLSVPFDWMLLPTMRLTRWLAVKRPGIELIVGGHAVTRLWNDRQMEFFRLLEANWVSVGEGERSLQHLMRFLDDRTPPPLGGPLVMLPSKHHSIPTPAAEPAFSAGTGPPDFSDLRLTDYLRPTPILPVPASDGCFFGGCLFCSRQRSDQAVPYVERSPDHVADDVRKLASLYKASQFILAEDILSHRFMLKLAKLLDGEDVTWFCEASFKGAMVRRLRSEDYAALHRGGCRIILNGLESASARMRDRMGCSVDLDDFDRNMERLVSSGIIPYITMIFGYPGETTADVWESIQYMRRHIGHAVFATSRFWVVPGTSLALELQSRPGAVCTRRSVLDGGLEYASHDTVSAPVANQLLTTELPGAFGPAAQFIRSIPILMQMLHRTSCEQPALAETREV